MREPHVSGTLSFDTKEVNRPFIMVKGLLNMYVTYASFSNASLMRRIDSTIFSSEVA